MLCLSNALNSRELAVLIWLGVLFVWMLSRRDLRRALANVVAAAAQPLVVGSTLVMFAYTLGLAVLGSWVGLWNPDLIKETAIWFGGVGLGLLTSVGLVLDRDHFFRIAAFKVFRIALLIEFFVNLKVLSLPVELTLAPVLFLLVASSAVAKGREDLRPAKTLVDGILALVGVALFAYVIVQLTTDWHNFDRREALQTLALPIWLTIGVLPFIYAAALFGGYQQAFSRINAATTDRRVRLRAKTALLAGMHLRARDLSDFNQYRASEAVSGGSYRGAREVVAKVRAGRQEELQAEADRLERLRQFAGVEGVDEEGRRLDRREFDETTEALQWIASCQSGWYSNPEKRYRDDLLGFLARIVHEAAAAPGSGAADLSA